MFSDSHTRYVPRDAVVAPEGIKNSGPLGHVISDNCNNGSSRVSPPLYQQEGSWRPDDKSTVIKTHRHASLSEALGTWLCQGMRSPILTVGCNGSIHSLIAWEIKIQRSIVPWEWEYAANLVSPNVSPPRVFKVAISHKKCRTGVFVEWWLITQKLVRIIIVVYKAYVILLRRVANQRILVGWVQNQTNHSIPYYNI